ncbi:MAG TPA: molybdopterin cofactor-binding domain-containing protein [Anaerolineales bacterium]|nr:molybdopterin cofactor-binding domain-containing protein [Anaerolineales bacterium]
MTSAGPLDRRDFLKVAATAGGGLMLSIYLPACAPVPTTLGPTGTPSGRPTLEGPTTLAPAAYVRLDADGTVTITVHRSEMGQGVRTALPMILAEELDADWGTIRVEQADGDISQTYGDQNTGGSVSISGFYLPFRIAGAVARDLLRTAAAQVWGIDKEQCATEPGFVVRLGSAQRLPYGYLVPLAATLRVPYADQVELKNEDDFRIVGTRVPRIDGPGLVTGAARFGMDVRLPGMLYAVVARGAGIGEHLTGYDDAEARRVPGVRAIVPLPNAVGVVAETTWSALEGRRTLRITTEGGPAKDYGSRADEQSIWAAMQAEAKADELVAYYVVPYYSHAPMEPMDCVVDARTDRCEAWVSTQDPQAVAQAILRQTRLPATRVAVHVPLLGGGFGRRLDNNDPIPTVLETLAISQAVEAPVLMMWTREEDLQHDYYHPLSVTRVSASLTKVGQPSVVRREADSIPTGAWRAVTNVPEAFARECFIDEYAAALGQDPLALRRLLFPHGAARAVIDLAAEKAGWGTPLAPGRGRGLAFHATWGATPVAQVAEVTVDPKGQVRVDRVVCAVDCGQVINPSLVEAQMEGGIIFGLTAALKGMIQVENGRVLQTNFDDYPLLRLDETPEIEVYIVPSHERPSGIGEMANPVIAPAVANAVFAATGKPVRRLPILPDDLTRA